MVDGKIGFDVLFQNVDSDVWCDFMCCIEVDVLVKQGFDFEFYVVVFLMFVGCEVLVDMYNCYVNLMCCVLGQGVDVVFYCEGMV